jgi:menaquinone-specific isochorismate synthase
MPIDLLTWLEGQKEIPKCYWRSREGVEYAACGSVLTLNEVPEFDKDNDSPARFWGGHAFFKEATPKDPIWNSFPRCAFFLPKWEIQKKGNEILLTVNAINGPLDDKLSFPTAPVATTAAGLKEGAHYPTENEWNYLIHSSLQKIEKTLFQKVVLARRSSHTLEMPLHPFSLLAKLPKNSRSFPFALQFSQGTTFLGVSPERLYKREGSKLETEAVAGTLKRGKTEEEDAAIERELLEDLKLLHEFTLVKTSIQEGLSSLCISLHCQEDDQILKTPNVLHLYNPFEGTLRENVSDKSLLAALHPTAAMGGLPKRSALEHLATEEPFERGWYASPIGYISQAKAEFAVGIRSGLLEKGELHLFAGAGIVSGSIAEKEWEELNHKMAIWKGI